MIAGVYMIQMYMRYRCVFRVRDDHVYDISDDDRCRSQLSSSFAGDVWDARMGRLLTLRCLSLATVVDTITYRTNTYTVAQNRGHFVWLFTSSKRSIQFCMILMQSNAGLIDWLSYFTSHSTQNRSFRGRSPSQSLGLLWKPVLSACVNSICVNFVVALRGGMQKPGFHLRRLLLDFQHEMLSGTIPAGFLNKVYSSRVSKDGKIEAIHGLLEQQQTCAC